MRTPPNDYAVHLRGNDLFGRQIAERLLPPDVDAEDILGEHIAALFLQPEADALHSRGRPELFVRAFGTQELLEGHYHPSRVERASVRSGAWVMVASAQQPMGIAPGLP